MESTAYLLKTIVFSRKGLKLEDIIRLICFDKESSEFDKNLESIITFLRKYSKYIKCIGYGDKTSDICVKFVFNLNSIPPLTLDEINSIS